MAYRFEKEENGEYAIVIDGWEQGIAADPYSGPNQLFNVNLNVPKEVSVGYPLTSSTISGATLATPIAKSVRFFTYTTPGVPTGVPQSFAILDASGQVFESPSVNGTWTYLSSNATTTGASDRDGLVYWLGYLFKFRNDAVDYWNGTTWVNNWQTIFGGVKHFAYVATDNVLYFTNNNYAGSITAPTPTSFNPTLAGTYAFSTTKLELPVTDTAVSLAEVGGGNTPQSTLLIGGTQNAIYPWDKVSSSFALPIYVGDTYIKYMISVNQNAFIFTGNTTGRGRIYITNGSQADVYFKIPDYVFGSIDPYFEWGDAIYHRNNLLFGFLPSLNSGSAPINNLNYVWALDLDTKAFRSVSQLPSTSTSIFYSYATVLMPAYNLSIPGFGYIVGSGTGSIGSANNSISYSGTTAGIGSATILTELIPIGTFLQKKTFTQVEYKLRNPLATGETLVMTALTDNNLSSALTFNPNPVAGALSGVSPVSFQNNQWVQFQVSTTGNSQSSGVQLREIRIR